MAMQGRDPNRTAPGGGYLDIAVVDQGNGTGAVVVTGGTGGGGSSGSVTAAGTNGTNAQAVQGINNGVPLRSITTDPSSGAGASVATYHQGDAQTVAGSGNSLLTSGVAQLLDGVGLSDRQRATGVDGVTALGIASGTAQLASPFSVTSSTAVAKGAAPAGGAGIALTLSALSGTNRGAPWVIAPGTMALIDVSPNAEACYVISVTATTATVVFSSAGALYAHSSGAAFASNVYNQARDATTADGSTGQGFAAGATYLLNGTLNGGVGGWEGERSAAGELDGATGKGTAVAAEYEFNGGGPIAGGVPSNLAFDRGRNLQGKGVNSTTLGSAAGANATSVTLASASGLVAGQQIVLEPGTASEEVVYVMATFAGSAGTNVVVSIQGLTQFAHSSGAVAKFSRYAAYGPRLNEVVADGIDIAEDIVYARTANGGLGGYFVDTAADADAISPNNVPEEAIGLFNASTGFMDRLREAPGPTIGAAQVQQIPIGIGALFAVPTTGTSAAPVALGAAPTGTSSFAFYLAAGQSITYTFATSAANAATAFSNNLYSVASNPASTGGDVIRIDNFVSSQMSVYVGVATGAGTPAIVRARFL